jgi:hypothetical protein
MRGAPQHGFSATIWIERAEQRRYVVERVGRSIIARFFDVALGGGAWQSKEDAKPKRVRCRQQPLSSL